MQTIEIRKSNDEYKLYVNGELQERLCDLTTDSNELVDFAWDSQVNVFSKFPTITAESIPDKLTIDTFYNSHNYPNLTFLEITKIDNLFTILFHFSYHWKNWDFPVKMDEFLRMLFNELRPSLDLYLVSPLKSYDDGCDIVLSLKTSITGSIKTRIEHLAKKIKQAHYLLEHKMLKKGIEKAGSVDEVNFFDGEVTLNEYQGKFFKINLPKIYNSIQNKINQKKPT